MSIIVAGIHTGIGKTICSAVICQALGWDYWKPVQAGDLENSDSVFIRKNVNNPSCFIHPEAYRLSVPSSPHYAAAADGIEIKRELIKLPLSANKMVVETAGGLMSPLAKDFLNIDLIEWLNLPVILVSLDYLGSINHTLLSVAALRQRNLTVKGIVFSGETVESTRQFILEHTQLPLLFSIPQLTTPEPETLQKFASEVLINIL
ncbi:dethiobiotin synthase [soil metagenome]